jgi:hypothetical protein
MYLFLAMLANTRCFSPCWPTAIALRHAGQVTMFLAMLAKCICFSLCWPNALHLAMLARKLDTCHNKEHKLAIMAKTFSQLVQKE